MSIDRVTLLKYLKCLDEAKLLRCLYTELDKITDLQKPDKLLMDNTNLLYTFSETEPEKGTVRETFFCNQLSSAGHVVEYGGIKTGDFRIDKKTVIEVGGQGKDWSQIGGEDLTGAALAVDDIELASGKRFRSGLSAACIDNNGFSASESAISGFFRANFSRRFAVDVRVGKTKEGGAAV